VPIGAHDWGRGLSARLRTFRENLRSCAAIVPSKHPLISNGSVLRWISLFCLVGPQNVTLTRKPAITVFPICESAPISA
jgi:hypothetical protein